MAAAKIVQCDSFIEKLPQGYDTYISEENSVLSSGEKSSWRLPEPFWQIRRS